MTTTTPSQKPTPGMCSTLRHIRREHSSFNLRTGEMSGIEKVTWATEPCSVPLFGADRERGTCHMCASGWEVLGSRFATSCTLAQAQSDYDAPPAAAKPAPSNFDLCKGLMALARGDLPLSWPDRVLLGQVMARLAPPAAPAEPAGWREALQYYAEKSHFTISDEDAWDTVSGEPQNFWCDEAGTATVEDGTVAAMALRGTPIALDPDDFECCGRPVVGAEYMGQSEMVCCGNPEPKGAAAEHHGLDTAERVCFYEQDFYVLSNFSSFTLDWNAYRFDTSEAAYHYEKFPDHHRIRTAILNAPSAHEAFKIAERNKEHRRPDWDDVKIGIMRRILCAKAQQHEYVRRKLLATGDRELVENSWRDDFWGWGPNRDGKNMLGRLWMEIRTMLREDGAS